MDVTSLGVRKVPLVADQYDGPLGRDGDLDPNDAVETCRIACHHADQALEALDGGNLAEARHRLYLILEELG